MNGTPQESGPTIPPPPGWYQDPRTQAPRWWDGTQWGPVAAASPASQPGTNTALSVICHLGMLVFAIVVPLVVYLTIGKDDPDVRHHAREALNFQITFFLVWIAAGLLTLFVGFGSVMAAGDGAPPVGFFLMFPLMFGLFFAGIGLGIYGAVQAGRGLRWRYPISIRLVGRSEANRP